MATDFDTIAAISTPPGEGGIGIVRVSGEDALTIIDQLYRMNDKKLSRVDSHTVHYGHIVDPEKNQVIDEVMVSVLKGPKTYTREDIVEINTHGGMLVTNQVLQAVLSQGARLAQPGEFTKRAFLNGRIDLSQAEAVMDVIESKTEASKSNAFNQLSGDLSEVVENLRREILNVLAQVEVNIDYPEYDDVEEATTALLLTEAKSVLQDIEALLKSSTEGRILREGLSTVIVGKPNVGKSSLLNYLIQDNKAIVTDVAGTTRDILEEYVNVNGIPLKLVDTAGIRETDDIVEKIGVERSREALKGAELILYVMNNNDELTPEDIELLNSADDKKVIGIVNKLDLDNKLDIKYLEEHFKIPLIKTSIINDQGVDALENEIQKMFFDGSLSSTDSTYVSNNRHINLLEQAKTSIEDAISSAEMDVPVDIVQIDLIKTWELLGEVIGEDVSEQLIDKLFSQFCLGK